MKKFKKLFALAMCTVMAVGCLAGCGSSSAASAQVTNFEMLTGVAPETVMLTVDGVEVTAEEYYYQIFAAASYFASAYSGMIDTSSFDWVDQAVTKEMITSAACESALVAKVAAEEGVTLNDEQKSEVQTAMQNYRDNCGGDEKAMAETLFKTFGLSVNAFQKILESSFLFGNLQDHFFGDNGKTPITDEQVQQYVEDAGVYRTKYLLLSNTEYSEEDAMKLGNELLEELASSEDPEAAFSEMITEYSYDKGSAANGTVFSAGQCVAAFEEAARALEEGTFVEAPVADGTYGWFLIYRMPLDDLSSYKTRVMSSEFQTLVESWIAKADVVENEKCDSISYSDYIVSMASMNAGNDN